MKTSKINEHTELGIERKTDCEWKNEEMNECLNLKKKKKRSKN